MARLNVIDADSAELYRKTMKVMDAAAVEAAPEVFRWLAWAAAIGVLEIVRRKTGSTVLLLLNAVLYVVIASRVIARVAPWRRRETDMPDGSIVIERWPRWMVTLQAVAVVGSWAAAYLLAFEIPRQIAAADLLGSTSSSVEAPAGRHPAIREPVATPLQRATEGEEHAAPTRNPAPQVSDP